MSGWVPGPEVVIWILRDYWMKSDSTIVPFQIMMLPFYTEPVTEILGLTPVISLDHRNSFPMISGNIEFLKFDNLRLYLVLLIQT